MVDNFDESAETTPLVPADGTAPFPPVIPAVAPVPETSAPVRAEVTPASRDVVNVPRRWLVWGGSALLALVVLGGVFSAGVAVGDRASGVRGGIGGAEMSSARAGVPGQGYGHGFGDDDSDRYEDGTDREDGGTGRRGESGGRLPDGHPWQNTPEGQDSVQAQ